MNSKLRSDSVFAQLTNEQIEVLEDWLFEDKLGYKEVMEKAKQEWDVKTSLTALGRFYRRLALQREEERRLETVALCLESLAAKNNGTLQAGLLALANQCAIEFLVEHPKSMREFTGMLRALTSAGMFEMKHVEFQRAGEERRRRQMEQAEQEERRLAKLAAKKAATNAAMTNDQGPNETVRPLERGAPNAVLDSGVTAEGRMPNHQVPNAQADEQAGGRTPNIEKEAEKPLITA